MPACRTCSASPWPWWLSTLAIALVLLMLPPQQPPVPRSVILLDPILLILILGGSRLGYRVWKERRLRNVLGSPGKPVVILGAGDAAADLLKNLARAGDWRVLGLLDDNPAKRGRQIQGVNVLGALEELVDLAPRLGGAGHYRHALGLAPVAPARAGDLPPRRRGSPDRALVSGSGERKVTVSQVRNIELDDLLGRDPVLLDESRLQEWIRGRSILVTGAGGSIGSELCRQIARFEPAQLVLYEHNEFALYRMEQEFAEQHPQIRVALCHRRCQERRARGRGADRAPPRDRVPRGGLQACAADGRGQRLGGDPEQRARHLARGRGGHRAWGGEIRARLHRQGGQPDQRDGREQAPGGNRLPGTAGEGFHPLRHRALRQRARQHRQRDPEVPRADRARRPGHRHASRDHALFHVDPGSGATGAAGGTHGKRAGKYSCSTWASR